MRVVSKAARVAASRTATISTPSGVGTSAGPAGRNMSGGCPIRVHPRAVSEGVGVALQTRNGVSSSSVVKNAVISSSTGSSGSCTGRSSAAALTKANGALLSNATKSFDRVVR